MTERPTVFIADDDPDAVRLLQRLLKSVSLRSRAYSTPRELLAEYDPSVSGCLVLDVRMPDISGLELQEQLLAAGCRHPIIFVTGHGDVSVCTRAFKAGAFDFVEKPFQHQHLLELVQQAIQVDATRRSMETGRRDISGCSGQLTPREREVMGLLVEGKSIKQVAAELNITFPTAARHRSRVLAKMKVENDVELVRLMLVAETPAW